MRKFELYYKDYIIGNIKMNEDSFLYAPNSEVIKKIEEEIILEFLKEKIDYYHPYFKSRIENMDKFNLKSIKYINSNYELKEII